MPLKNLIVILWCFILTIKQIDYCQYNLHPNVAEHKIKQIDELADVMVPIPMEHRVFNKTGNQCTWCALETCGRYAQENKLINLAKDPDCEGYSTLIDVIKKLKKLDVKFEQSTNKLDRRLIIKSVVKEKRGCLFGVRNKNTGHAMTLVHYDEKNKIVKFINNSDPNLKIRTWSMDEFNKRWDGWICVVYADKDIIRQKNKKEYLQLLQAKMLICNYNFF